jgi:glycine betaine catabolism B
MKMALWRVSNPGGEIYSFQFEPERPLDYIAGQFAEFTIEHPNPDAKGIRRWFTLSSSPTEPHVAITVRCEGKLSSFKQALSQLQPGDTILVSDPMGDFVLPLDTSIPLAWIAGGIGITPYRSMAQWLTDSKEQRDIKLVHCINKPADAIYSEVFNIAGISEREVIDTSDRQRPDIDKLLLSIPDARQRLIYISGPEIMVENLRQDFMKAGFRRDDVIVDQFLGYD